MGRNFWSKFKKPHKSQTKHSGFFGGVGDWAKKAAKDLEKAGEVIVGKAEEVLSDVEEGLEVVEDVFVEEAEKEVEVLKKALKHPLGDGDIHFPFPSKPKPIPPRQPTIPKEPDAPVKPHAPPVIVEPIAEAEDRHNQKVLDGELQALESVEEKEVDLLGRMATKLDPPTNFKDIMKDLSEFASKQAQEEYLEENFKVFSSLTPNEMSRALSVLG